jgi:O-antigen ligase
LNINDKNISQLLKFDNIKIIMLVYVFITTFTYFFYSKDIEEIEANYSRLTGNRPVGLYFKVALNSIFAILIFGFAYSYGILIATRKTTLDFIIKVLIYFFLINAIANISQWIISTGGVIGRYNFTPPLINSQGTSISCSILGFLLLLSTNVIKYKFYRILFLFVFAFSILIIVTRQAQLSFVIILILYNILKTGKISINFVIKFSTIMTILVVSFYFLFQKLNISDLFSEASNADSVDVIVRLEILSEAYRIFTEHAIFGVGYGFFSLYNQIYVFVAGEMVFLASAHNGLFSILSETGIFGLTLIFVLIYIIFNKIIKARAYLSNVRHEKHDLINLILSMMIIYTFNIFISNFFLFPPPSEYDYIGQCFIMWLLIGVTSGFLNSKNQLN